MSESGGGESGRTHLIVGTPCYGGMVTQRFLISMLKLQAACPGANVDLSFRFLGGEALITRARNLLVEQLLEDQTATHLLFIDSDIGFTAEHVFRLLRHDKDIVGGVYPLKGLDWDRIGHAARIGDPMASTFGYVVDYLDPHNVTAINGFARVRYVGNGFMLIKRSVFERMAAHYPETEYRGVDTSQNFLNVTARRYALFDCIIDPATGRYLSEDYTFCKRWFDMGGEIWADLESKLIHVGQTEYHGDVMSTFRTKIGATAPAG
jgi:hypothetical protein